MNCRHKKHTIVKVLNRFNCAFFYSYFDVLKNLILGTYLKDCRIQVHEILRIGLKYFSNYKQYLEF